MPRKPENLVKTTVRMYAEDKALIEMVYKGIGEQLAIRTIIKQHCDFLRRNMSSPSLPDVPAEELSFDVTE